MLAGIKQRHMRLIIDLVVNHTSDEHAGSSRAASPKDNPYRDYYIWRPGKPSPNGSMAAAQQLSVLLLRLGLAVRSRHEASTTCTTSQ